MQGWTDSMIHSQEAAGIFTVAFTLVTLFIAVFLTAHFLRPLLFSLFRPPKDLARYEKFIKTLNIFIWTDFVFIGIFWNIKILKSLNTVVIPFLGLIYLGIYVLMAVCPNCGSFLVKISDLFNPRYYQGAARTILGRRFCPKCSFTYKPSSIGKAT